MPLAVAEPRPMTCTAHAFSALPAARRPAWVALAVGWLVGLLAFCAVIIGMAFLFGSVQVSRDHVWMVPDTGWQPWALVSLAALLPLLTAAGTTIWLAHGTQPSRSSLRACATVLLPLGGIQALSSISGEPRAFFTLGGWWSASPERLVAVSLGVNLVGVLLALAITRLVFAAANWQPPAHLVRRPAMHR